MYQCLNPDCLYENPSDSDPKFCQYCGSKLRLTERYIAIEIIGQGGFGRTFKAIDRHQFDDFCVIKQFLPVAKETETRHKATELFQREARQLKLLGQHPQIPQLYAYFTAQDDKRQYLVQEFIDGNNLQQELEISGAFTETQIRQLLADLLPVLQFVHTNQVIHRDIKPENIIRRSIDNKLVLVDFGASKYISPNLSKTEKMTVIGTPEYASPEQIQENSRATFASDIYSLGITCIHLLTGLSPLELEDETGTWIWQNYLNLADPVSEELIELLDKMLCKDAKIRYQSVQEVLQDFESIPNEPGRNYYSKLIELLKAKKWKEADEETAKIMLKVANREQQGWLNNQSIEDFPCAHLRTIDQLWLQYSAGKFGFTVQKEIYIETGNKLSQYDKKAFDRFGDVIGWRKENVIKKGWFAWELNYDNLNFSQSAPRGHLPAVAMQPLIKRFFQGERIGTFFSTLVQRLDVCKI
ncbi:GUN4 domain-containing protein [Lyngbya sp. PCC 8106]|uniref:protein kinase domain-containing protein n=1 Tax=Lyngbya sp. (strain PCC 8106) TaxID=313612 RepID=UPI0000EAB6D1|nr:GUN4 domain-containing protein [Lyngbya sp. PCC 8106]EAW34476.1 serine/threonine kinase [Lyngbya sp. PCC 8106]